MTIKTLLISSPEPIPEVIARISKLEGLEIPVDNDISGGLESTSNFITVHVDTASISVPAVISVIGSVWAAKVANRKEQGSHSSTITVKIVRVGLKDETVVIMGTEEAQRSTTEGLSASPLEREM